MSKGSDAGASPINPAAEKRALEWLDATANNNHEGLTYSFKAVLWATTIKQLLAEPRLPAEPTWEELCAIDAVLEKFLGDKATNRKSLNEAIYRALYAHLTKPAKTKREVLVCALGHLSPTRQGAWSGNIPRDEWNALLDAAEAHLRTMPKEGT